MTLWHPCHALVCPVIKIPQFTKWEFKICIPNTQQSKTHHTIPTHRHLFVYTLSFSAMEHLYTMSFSMAMSSSAVAPAILTHLSGEFRYRSEYTSAPHIIIGISDRETRIVLVWLCLCINQSLKSRKPWKKKWKVSHVNENWFLFP